MADILHLLLKGLSLGIIYALASMGFVLLFKTSGVVNLAHGQLMAAGAFIFLLLSSLPGLPVAAAFLLSILSSLVLVLAVERFFIHRLSADDTTTGIFMTLGIALMIKGLISFISQGDILNNINPAANISKKLGGLGISSLDVFILISGAILIFIFLSFFRHSAWGLYLRAAADNRAASVSLGMSIEKLYTIAWVIAGTTACVSGILLTIGSGLNIGALSHMETIIFPAIVLGGLGSMPGAIMGGLVIGLLETVDGGQGSGLLKDVLPYLVLLLALAIKPYGLYSGKENNHGGTA
jgi:branched-chain amino acid transport system permease protein